MRTLSISSVLAVLSLLPSVQAQTQPAVPSQFQDVYKDVNSSLTSFQSKLSSLGDSSAFPVLYSAQLQTATSDQSTKLLKPSYYQGAVLSELNALQALGVKAVTFHVNFPILYKPSSDPVEYQGYLDFYTQLVNEIHSRGLKVIIENTSGVVFPGTNADTLASSYKGLTWATYQKERAELAAHIATMLHPDYMVLITEPDTEASNSSQPMVNTVAGGTQMLQGMISAIQAAGATDVQLSAGCGTWNPQFLQFIQSFSKLSLPMIDMHIYPVNKNNLPNALVATKIIKAAGKQPTLSEAWDYKESDADYVKNLPYTTIFARDAYSFWQSTDISFLKTMSQFADYGHFAFVSPFWSHYFGAYLTYNANGASSDSAVITASNTAATQANMKGAFTATGIAYHDMIIPAADRTAPYVPAPLAVQGYSQTAATLVVAPTSDNVGVAAYNVYRNNALVATVNSPLTFSDSGLTPNTSYTYNVAAFDAVGNLSPKSAPIKITTYNVPDKTAPTAPGALHATSSKATQMDLHWTASTDNVAVAGYLIYRGTTASNIALFGSSSTASFTDLKVLPSQTYIYQVQAYDAVTNRSPLSAAVSGVTLADETAPTTPTGVSADSPTRSANSLTWGASTDNIKVAGYRVFRGTMPSNLQLIGSVPASTLNYGDSRATSNRTYYYAVSAVDTAGNVSPQSAEVRVITR